MLACIDAQKKPTLPFVGHEQRSMCLEDDMAHVHGETGMPTIILLPKKWSSLNCTSQTGSCAYVMCNRKSIIQTLKMMIDILLCIKWKVLCLYTNNIVSLIQESFGPTVFG